MTDRPLPYGRQWLDEEDVRRVVEILRSDYLTTGPAVDRFEGGLAAASGARHAVAVNSGTAALHCAYFAAGLGAGDEIVTSPLTFAATANAALYLGARVRFADVSPDTGNLDPEALEDAIGDATRLIVPVDFAGHPADYDAIRAVADRHGLALVADAAHSFGARYRGAPVGTLATASAVSFHPVKPITTAEGGAVLSDREEIAVRARRFRSHGIVRDADELCGNDGPWYYEMHDLGYNYRLTDVQCALGIGQLGRLGAFIERRRAIARSYDAAFADLDGIVLPSERAGVESGYHLYVIRVAGDPALRRPLFERLRELGLGVQVHYLPVHLHPYYRELGYRPGSLPVAEDFYRRCISLPIFPKMSDDDVASSIERVERAVREIL